MVTDSCPHGFPTGQHCPVCALFGKDTAINGGMNELQALRIVNNLNLRETGQDRYFAVEVMYNWVIWVAPGGFYELARIHMTGRNKSGDNF